MMSAISYQSGNQLVSVPSPKAKYSLNTRVLYGAREMSAPASPASGSTGGSATASSDDATFVRRVQSEGTISDMDPDENLYAKIASTSQSDADSAPQSESFLDDNHGFDSLDFTEQFGGHFLEKLTDLWARYYISKQKDIENLKQKLKIDKIAAGGQEIRRRISTNANKHTARLNQVLKVKELMKLTKETPFLRTKDKISFMFGIFLLMLTEYFLLVWPTQLHWVYTILSVPLLLTRFMLYHKAKWHYFMLDFCYYCQIVLLFCLYVIPHNQIYFRVTFALMNGPLLMAVIAWQNSLVFHDIDKLTSLFIHIYPPLVVFCERWYIRADTIDAISPSELGLGVSLKHGLFVPIVFYILWQVFYSLKTDFLDRHKLDNDPDMITSSRWLSEIRPHPLYLMVLKKGIKLPPPLVLSAFQLVYTFLTLIPAMLAFHYFWAHALLLLTAFAAAVWYGSQYYFEVFTINYSKRLQKQIEDAQQQQQAGSENKEKRHHEHDPDREEHHAAQYGPSSWLSVVSFISFFVLFLSCFISLVAYFCS